MQYMSMYTRVPRYLKTMYLVLGTRYLLTHILENSKNQNLKKENS